MSRQFIGRAELIDGDVSPAKVDSMVRTGALHRIRRGQYVDGPRWREADEIERHRLKALELGHHLDGRAAISHESAAVLLGLELPPVRLDRVNATWPGSAGRHGTRNLHVHRGRLSDADLVRVDGILMTSAARTLFDVARASSPERALSAADSALRYKLTTAEAVAEVLDRNRRARGVFAARRILEFADGRAESVGESICRLRFAQFGLPVPTLQSEFLLPRGFGTVRVDFWFEKFHVVGEFDGKIKYGRLLGPGQDPGEVVFAEKIREDHIRETDREVIRIIWRDFTDEPAVVARFAAAAARAGFPDWSPGRARFMR